MKTLVWTICVALGLSVAVLNGLTIRTATACPSTNSASLTGNVTEYFNVNNDASFVLQADWATKATPFIGVVDAFPGESTGVSSLSYSPAYFFPTSCDPAGTVAVTVTCHKEGSGDHVVSSRLQVGPTPNNALASFVTDIE